MINPNLFQDPEGDELAARVARGEVTIIKADPDDPFGDDVLENHPEFSPQHKAKPSTDEVAIKIKKSKALFRAKTFALYESRGYWGYPLERSTQFWAGGQNNVVTNDGLGLFDAEFFKGLETIGVNFTSKSSLGSHVTKWCSHTPISGKDKTWRATWLRRWLEAGRRAVLIGWYKDGARWKCEVRELTLETLDAHEPRTRKVK